MSDELRRLETLERLVRQLAHDVAELRAELRGASHRASTDEPVATRPASWTPVAAPVVSPASSAAAPAEAVPESAPAHTHPRRLPRPEHLDLEKLVGRYGTVALAVLTIVMGVGVFLRWAVEHVEIGPLQRVALGAAAAVGVGAFGWRLRSRGAKQYGDMLVGLSLALVHVVAWGAGPYLRVVPDSVALAIAATASVFLAALAWHEREQPLFAAGLGGAFLAPFVTTRSVGSPEMLLGYAAPIVVSGTLALRRGDWRVARRILALGTLLFAGAALAALPDGGPWSRLVEGPAFALGAALVAQLLAGEAHRRALAYTNLGSTLVVMLAWASSTSPPAAAAAALGLAGALVAAVASRGEGDAVGGTFELAMSGTGTFSIGEPDGDPVPWVGAVGFPLAFMGVALFALGDPMTREGGAVALAFATLAAAMAAAQWRAGAERRGAHLVTAGVAGTVALLLALHPTPMPLALALAGLGVVASAVAARLATPLALVPALLALAMGTAAAGVQLAERPAWTYTPFATAASLAALGTVVAWWLAAREASALARLRGRARDVKDARDAAREAQRSAEPHHVDEEQRREPRRRARAVEDGAVLQWVAYAVALGWGREELRHAFSPAMATFLLVAYYALVGVVTIGVGRARGAAGARRVGLALAVLAGLKAIVQVSGIDAIGLRVGSYLLVGAFLLGVAWWYRKGAVDPHADDDPAYATDAPDVPAGPAALPPTPTSPGSARPVHNAR